MTSFDEISTTLTRLVKSNARKAHTHIVVQGRRGDNIVVNDIDVETTIFGRGKILHKLSQLWSTNTVGTIDCKVTFNCATTHDFLECVCHLLVITFFSWRPEIVLW